MPGEQGHPDAGPDPDLMAGQVEWAVEAVEDAVGGPLGDGLRGACSDVGDDGEELVAAVAPEQVALAKAVS